MEKLLQDARYALRAFRNNPGFAAVGVLTLALGIGANTAIFSVVDAVLLRPLPFTDPDALVMVWQDHTRVDGPIDEWVTPDNFFDWRDRNGVFSGIFVFGGFRPTLTDVEEPEMLSGAAASHDVFTILGVEPVLGRGFLPEEDTANGDPVVILGHDLWQRRFDGDESIIGTAITLDGSPWTVIGVMPPDFEFPVSGGTDIFQPMRVDLTNSCGRGCVTLNAIARLDAGVTLQEAQANMAAIAADLEREYPGPNGGVGIYLQPLHERVVGPISAGLWLLLGAVGFVLLIACANVANLMLARATDRRREVAIRVAMGAGRGRLFRQMITESLILSGAGAIGGLILALWGVDFLVALVPDNVPRFDEVGIDATAMAFTLAMAAFTGLLFGVVPALRASKPYLSSSLKEGTQAAGVGQGGLRLRSALVVAEVALALTLLIGGGLLLRGFAGLMSVDPGFDADNVLTQQLFLPPAGYPETPQLIGFVDEMTERAAALPGVQGAGVISTLPMGVGNEDNSFLIESKPRPQAGERPPVSWVRPVSPGYLSTMKLRLVGGRWLDDGDHREAPLVVMINEAAAARYWEGDDPIGTRVTFDGSAWREVVGVVADTRHFGLDQAERPATYQPFAQSPRRFMSLVLRTTGDPLQLARAVQAEAREIDPDLAFSGVATMREVISGTVAAPRLVMALLVTFAAAAMLLAAIGIYGVLSYHVVQRRSEMGVRIALGAEFGDVVRLVVGRGMLLFSGGVALGLVMAYALSRFLESLLFGVSATDPLTFVLVPTGLAIIAFLACYVPARRASRVDPMVALRSE